MTLDPVLLRLALVVLVVAGCAMAGAWWRRRDGRLDPSARPVENGDGPGLHPDELRALGLDAQRPAAAVLFGAPSCRPCGNVRQVLSEVAAHRPHFGWVSVDAGEHLDLVRRHRVLRVPTLFVIDRSGAIVARTSGVPQREDLLALVDRHAGAESR